MKYLSLGDSISIDNYTGVPGGGAASQFVRLIQATDHQDLTYDGCTTSGVLGEMDNIRFRPDIVTLTAGGNDFLLAVGATFHAGAAPLDPEATVRAPLANLRAIAEKLAGYGCPVIMNTVYDPTDGDDLLAEQFGITPAARTAFNALNDGIRGIAARHRFLLADLEDLFHGHGVAAADTWFVMQIEPNLKGATAIAAKWLQVYRDHTPVNA